MWAHNPFLIHSEPNKNEYRSLNMRAPVGIYESDILSLKKSLQSHSGFLRSPQCTGGSRGERSEQTLGDVVWTKNMLQGWMKTHLRNCSGRKKTFFIHIKKVCIQIALLFQGRWKNSLYRETLTQSKSRSGHFKPSIISCILFIYLSHKNQIATDI